MAQVETHARTEELSVDAVSRLLTKARNTDRFKAAVDFFRRYARSGKPLPEEVVRKIRRTGDLVVTNAVLNEVLRQPQFNS